MLGCILLPCKQVGCDVLYTRRYRELVGDTPEYKVSNLRVLQAVERLGVCRTGVHPQLKEHVILWNTPAASCFC